MSTGGLGPHDLRLAPDGETLIVANGGLATDQADRARCVQSGAQRARSTRARGGSADVGDDDGAEPPRRMGGDGPGIAPPRAEAMLVVRPDRDVETRALPPETANFLGRMLAGMLAPPFR